MYPDAVLETTEKNELSYIFSLLRGNPGVSLYAIDASTGIIVGSTSEIDNGRDYTEIGFKSVNMHRLAKPVHLSINGIHSYCIFEYIDNTIIAYVISSGQLYDSILPYTAILTLCLLVIAFVLILAVQKFTDRYIIGSISSTNEKLRAVSMGDLDERVDIQTSLEFSELSSHINHMIKSLLSTTDKMSLILKYTNMPIGIYEYNHTAKNVRFTDHIPPILGLDDDAAEHLASDSKRMQEFIEQIKTQPVPNMEHTYCLDSQSERYVKLEEFIKDNDILGIVVDVTEDVISLRKAEAERDIDPLTGLLNRRGMESTFDRLFYKENTDLGCGAMIVIDLDDLKLVNDTHGHHLGDVYLQSYAQMLLDFDAPKHIAARVGGDEFVLLVYGYKNDEDLNNAFSVLRQIQDNKTIELEGGIKVVTKFSFGYQVIKDNRDYNKMLAFADEYMYNSKRLRKKLAAEAKDENRA